MSYKFKEIWCNKGNFTENNRKYSDIDTLVIHYTGNDGDTAENNGNYFKNNVVETSAHYFVDDTTVVRSVADKNIAWHAGDWDINCRSIGIEIAGYDRDLLKIYDLTTPTAPTCVYTCNLRALYNGNLTTPYLHTLGVAVSYPYIYCTVAPYPGKAIGMTMEGLAVVNVADINNISVTLHAMTDSDRTTESTGEPAPCSIALRENYLFTDNAEKGFAVWTITNPAIPTYVGNISTGTQVCSVQTTDDGRIFCGSTYKNKKINIYR